MSHDGGLAGAQRVLLSTLQGLHPNVVLAHLVVPYYGELESIVSAAEIGVSRRAIRPWAPCVANIGSVGRFGALRLALHDFRSRVWAISRLIERLDIEVVYTNTAIVLEGAIAAMLTRKPHVWHIHEPITGNPELLPLLPNWIYCAGIDHLADRVIMPSQALLRSYTRLSSKTSVIHNSVAAPSHIDREQAANRLRAMLGFPTDSPLIGTVGAIQPRKDYATLIKAAKEVHSRLPNARFIVVGSGATDLVRRFDADVISAGLQSVVTRLPRWDDQIFSFFAGIDLTVVSSVQESFGLTVAESLAVGTTVVSTRCGGPEEVIGQDANECLVEIGDSVGLARAIIALVQEPERSRHLGEKGRKRVLSDFSQQRYLESVASVIRRTAESRRRNAPERT